MSGATRPSGVVRGMVLWLSALAMLAWAPEVHAHGDTIRVAYSGVKPAKLVITAGTEVHFHNANASGAVCTIVLQRDGETVEESPTLGRAEGWHHVFAEPGSYSFFLKEYTSRRGEVLVVPKRDP